MLSSWKRIGVVLVQGSFVAFLGVLLALLVFPNTPRVVGRFIPLSTWLVNITNDDFEYAADYYGWDVISCWFMVTQGVVLWWAHVCISIALFKLKPISMYTPAAKQLLILVCIFFFSCGLSHLLEAITVFYPVFRIYLLSGLLNGLISVCGVLIVVIKALAKMPQSIPAKIKVIKNEISILEQEHESYLIELNNKKAELEILRGKK